jgi:hypothetical protein
MKSFVLAAGCVLAAWVPASAQIVRLSVTTDGVSGNDSHDSPSVSADGRFVVFDSTSSNLAAGDDDALLDVFLRDRDTDADGVFDEPGAVATTCVSATAPVATAMNRLPKITPDGRYVFFISAPLIFVPEAAAVWRLDRQTGTLAKVADGASLTGLYEASANGDVVVIDRQVHEIAAARVTTVPDPYVPAPPPPMARLVYGPPSLSADGNRIAYFVGTYVVGGVSIQNPRIYLYDRPTATWSVVPVADPIGVALGATGATAVLVTPASIRRQVLASGAETRVLAAADFLAASPDQRYVLTSQGLLRDVDLSVTTPLGFQPAAAAFSANGRWLIVASIPDLPGTVDTNGESDIFAIDLAAFFDADVDTMDDRWETLFSITDPAADPDGDGQTNAQEENAGTHPNGQVQRFLAEGATGTFFHTTVGLANPNPSQAVVAVLTFDKGDGTRVRRPVSVPAGRSVAVDVGAVSGLEAADVSTTVESDRFLGVERGMAWGSGVGNRYGSHAETAAAAPSTTWFLAEGSTVLDFDLFYLLQNPQATTTEATVRFLLPSGTTITRNYSLPPGSRTTIYVNQIAGLGETDVSGDVTAAAPIVVERAMYRSLPGQPFGLGHGAMGVTAPATSWFLAEGATGSFFDLYVLIANPSSTDATVQARYARPDGSIVTQTYNVRANSRFSVYVDSIPTLDNTSVATTLTSTNAVPIVAERAMYWPGGFFDYYEGHASAGATGTGLNWIVGGADVGGANGAQTFVLIANADNRIGEATITLLPDAGFTGTVPAPVTVPLPATSRTTVPITSLTGTFGVLVTSTGASPVQLVVESAVYRTVGGVTWAAGSNALATPVP